MPRLLAVLAAIFLGLGSAALAPGASGNAAPPARTIAVTVDDLPSHPSGDVEEMRRITGGVLAALHRHRVSAVGFVNESKLEPDPPKWVLDLYREVTKRQ